MNEFVVKNQFLLSIFVIEVFVFIFFACSAKYNDASTLGGAGSTALYDAFQHVQIMVFFGLGFLYAFLRKHGFSSIGFCMLVGVMSMQVGITMRHLVHGIFKGTSTEFTFTIAECIMGEFAAATVLISWGGPLGRITPTQLIWFMFFELIFYSINEYLAIEDFQVKDIGGSMIVHVFAAYFGLGFCWSFGAPDEEEVEEEGSVYQSDVFSIAGTVFLWIFWPSFNSAFAGEEAYFKERAVINSYLSIGCSCVAAFFFSHFYLGQLDMVHIQNATLAGGVAAGTSCDLLMQPWVIFLIGLFAGFVSVTGYVHIGPWMKDNLGVYDVAGINSLHGMPGIIGAVAGIIVIATTDKDKYGNNFDTYYENSQEDQALKQLYTLLMTLLFSIAGGVITGMIVKMIPAKENPFSDEDDFNLPFAFSYHKGKKERRGSQVMMGGELEMFQISGQLRSKTEKANNV